MRVGDAVWMLCAFFLVTAPLFVRVSALEVHWQLLTTLAFVLVGALEVHWPHLQHILSTLVCRSVPLEVLW